MAGFSASSMDDGELTPSPSTRPGLFFPVRKTPSQRERARSVTSSTRAFMSASGEEKRFLRIFLRPLVALRSTRTATRSPSRAVPRWLGLSSSSGTVSVSHPRAAAAGSPFWGEKESCRSAGCGSCHAPGSGAPVLKRTCPFADARVFLPPPSGPPGRGNPASAGNPRSGRGPVRICSGVRNVRLPCDGSGGL